MQTGNISTFAGNIMDIGPMYPFVGSEVLLTIVGVVIWIGFHIYQFSNENKEIAKALELVKDKKIQDEYIRRK